MENQDSSISELVSGSHLFVDTADSLDNLKATQDRLSQDSIEVLADTGSRVISIQRTYFRQLTPDEKRSELIRLESKILSPQLLPYQRKETTLFVSPGTDIPDYLHSKYQEIISD